MPYPTINFKDDDGGDFGNKFITKEYLMSVYPQIAGQLITPELWVWGYGTFGELGDNTAVTRSTPVTTFAGGVNWKQISSTKAIKTDGTLWAWGYNLNGQIGDNTVVTRSTPVTTFAGGTDWKQCSEIASIKTDGTLWTWGLNSSGQLGIIGTTNRSTPVTTFAGGTNWRYVASFNNNCAAIKTDGTLWLWGSNGGQLGNNTMAAVRSETPITTFAGGTDWKQVTIGYNHTAAIKTDGTLWVWGDGSNGELGANVTANLLAIRCTPVTTFAGGTNWKQVSIGRFHVAAVKTDGTLWIWGSNFYGQLGIPSGLTSRITPITTFAGGTNWKQVSCGRHHTSAIKTDGTLWTWGDNTYGTLGDNTTTQRVTPVTTFAGGTNWKQVICNGYYTSAIKTSDDLQGI